MVIAIYSESSCLAILDSMILKGLSCRGGSSSANIFLRFGGECELLLMDSAGE